MAKNGMTEITVIGNVTNDPELRFTASGVAVISWRVASTPRVFNKNTNDWEDGETLFLTCNLWRQAAENAAATLAKGMRVIVNGHLKQRAYTTTEGENRISYEIEVDEVGPSLKYATATVVKAHNTTQQADQGTSSPQQGHGGYEQPQGHQGQNWGAAGNGGWNNG